MADHNADSSVVDSIIGIGIVERRLKNCGREADLIGCRVVICIHRLGRHEPLLAVNRLAQTVDVVGRVPAHRLDDIVPIALRGIHGERRIILPLVGITDLNRKCSQFLMCTRLRIVAHPFELVDMLAERRLQVLDQLQHALLVGGREVLGHIHLSDGLRKHAVGDCHNALPTRFHLLFSRHCLAVELERSLLEVIAQVGCRSIDICCRKIVAQILQGSILENVVGLLERRGGRHDQRREVADTHDLVICRPVDGVVTLLEILAGHRVVTRLGISQLDVRPELVGQRHLDIQHAVDSLSDLLLGHAVQAEAGCQVGAIILADLLVLGQQVVVAVRHHQSRLREIERIDLAVHHVGTHTAPEEGIGYRCMHAGNHRSKFRTVADRQDLLYRLGDWSRTLVVKPHRIHTEFVDVGNLLLDASGSRFAVVHRLEQLVDTFFVILGQNIECPVTRIFGFQRILLLPAARSKLVEILVQRHRAVEIRRIDCRHRTLLLCPSACGKDSGRNNYHQFFHFVKC